jgi:hypothetical protein
MAEEKKYDAESIKILEGLEGARRRFDVIELSRKVRKQGDSLILSYELKIKPAVLNRAIHEGRVLSLFPQLDKSKAAIISALRTNRELKIFSQKYDIYRTPARKLIILVRGWNQQIQKNPLLLVSPEEHDLIIGSLLGDASIRQRKKNSCFRFTHSLKQKTYAEFKNKILLNFNISEFREVKRKIGAYVIQAMDFSTKTHPMFNYYRNLFYKNGIKIVSKEILDQLNPRSLAFWICDDGSYDNKQGYIVICSNAYTFEEHQLMKKFFKEKFGLDPTIGFRDGKYYFLRFKQEDSKKLIEIIKPYITQSMKYKIGEIKNE